MNVHISTFDPGFQAASSEGYADEVARLVTQAWADGADLVLLPEFTWMGLEVFTHREATEAAPNHAVARLFWEVLYPALLPRLSQPDKAVVLGTVPFWDESTHRLFNRAPIIASGQESYQDKLHLTPWESDFSPGGILYIWPFLGFRMAVVICLDIEIPEISARLRGDGVDVILCPSATETELGVERVDRCASARAVELGCHVLVTHLTGKCQSGLVDESLGRLAHYMPSQAAFRKAPRWMETEVVDSGIHHMNVTLEARPLELMRRMSAETNPAHLGKDLAGHFLIHQVES